MIFKTLNVVLNDQLNTKYISSYFQTIINHDIEKKTPTNFYRNLSAWCLYNVTQRDAVSSFKFEVLTIKLHSKLRYSLKFQSFFSFIISFPSFHSSRREREKIEKMDKPCENDLRFSLGKAIYTQAPIDAPKTSIRKSCIEAHLFKGELLKEHKNKLGGGMISLTLSHKWKWIQGSL